MYLKQHHSRQYKQPSEEIADNTDRTLLFPCQNDPYLYSVLTKHHKEYMIYEANKSFIKILSTTAKQKKLKDRKVRNNK